MKFHPVIQVLTGAVLLFASTLQIACKKKPKGTFTVKGQLFDSCGGKPLSNRPLVVYYSSESGWTPKIADSIGFGQTDGNGSFSLQCHNQGSGFIDIYTPSSFSGHVYVKEYPVEKPENKTFELKGIYSWARYYGAVNFIITADFGPMDTLYIQGTPINPIPKGEFKQYYDFESYDATFTATAIKGGIGWSIGKKGPLHAFKVEYSPCKLEKISEILISGK